MVSRMRKTVWLALLAVGFCASALAIDDPVRAYLERFMPLGGGEKRFFSNDELMRLDVDLDGDGVNEVLLSLSRDRNGAQGNGWAVYQNKKGTFEYVGGATFGGGRFYVGPVDELKRHGLVSFWRGGGGTGVLLAFTLEHGNVTETTIGEVDRDELTGDLRGEARLNRYFGKDTPATRHEVQVILAPEFERRYGFKVESKTYDEYLREERSVTPAAATEPDQEGGVAVTQNVEEPASAGNPESELDVKRETIEARVKMGAVIGVLAAALLGVIHLAFRERRSASARG